MGTGSSASADVASAGPSSSIDRSLGADTEGQVFPGLPDELAVECLLRLPRGDHKNARRVCRQWNTLIQSEHFYELRRERGLSEGWLYVLTRDSTDRLWWRALDPRTSKWHDVPRMPGESARAYGVTCLACDGRLYVVGGAGWFKPSKQEVWCYRPPASKWKRVADLNSSRCYSMGGVMNERMYIVGGMGSDNASILSSGETYDPEKDRWSYVANLPVEGDLEDAVVTEGQLLVRHIRCIHLDPDRPCALRYDPLHDTWAHDNSPFAQVWHGPSVTLDGEMYMLDQIGGIKLLRFDRKSHAWEPMGRLSPSLLTPPCKLLGFQGRLYIIGRGASMVIVDLAVNKALGENSMGAPSNVLLTRRVEGVGNPSDVVVCCVVLEV